MAKFKVNKTSDYTVISNYHLKEREMSLKSKGLLTLMLSLPDDWNYSLKGLVSLCSESESAIKSSLQELKEFGYLRIQKIAPKKGNGKFEYIYEIFERPLKKEERQKVNKKVENEPVEKEVIEILKVENQPVENLQVENRPNILNTKELNTKECSSSSNNNILNNANNLKEKVKKELQPLFPEKNLEIIIYPNLRNITNLINTYGNNFFWETMARMKKSKFLMEDFKKNRNPGSFCLWLFKENNFLNIYNGAYDNNCKEEENEENNILKMTSQERQNYIKTKYFGGDSNGS